MGQSPASLIPEKDSIAISALIRKLVMHNHLCDNGKYSVIYKYNMEYSGNNVVEEIYKNTLIKNISFIYNDRNNVKEKKNYLQVEAFIYDENMKPLAVHLTYGNYIGGKPPKWYLRKVSPGSDTEKDMNFIASLQSGNKVAFLFELSVHKMTPGGYFIVWSDGVMKFYKSSMEGYYEISKSEYVNRLIHNPLLDFSNKQ